ncbi:tyrosine protein kinase receptor tie-1, putative [Ixodes scapularis]|uniref:Tyrosine protein kinase receptor tie-1, putative n=1 Tax=Ixodes scapularis TaxID=6945 RepID=B7P4G2_IXOSC|nr:tyrosine protein kinase receptor tie-1, putative [Ixodes scapularis]|eukprot:XP_002406016.1 tyrosine protein kinase receptor tie-1, putative [Ixodes scapularis]
MAKCARTAAVSAFLWLLALCPHRTIAQFDGNLTLQSTFGQLSAARKSRSLIQCWSSDSPARISFDKPGGLPRYSQQLLQGDEAHVLLLPASAGASRAGLFTCQQAVGGIVTSAATLKLPPSGKAQILPVKAYVVAHTGDNVQLSVTKQLRRSEPLVWMLEGLELPDFGDRETVTLEDVEPADAGVYECFYRGQRKALLHAWIRLIVVGCPKGKFGPACQQDCPPCRNGGICHDTWGVCICPAGFAGPNCDTACGENRVGAQCERTCSPPGQLASARHGCAIHLFCKPDPLGCSCAPGFKGPHCSQACLPGRFGDNCSLSCHCWNGHENCGPDGHCHDGCAPGWTGEYCQEECSEDTFGPDCAYTCHCATNSTPPCNPISGACGTCEPGYRGPSCQEKCSPGTHGTNCSLSCECLHGEICHHADGTCFCTGRHRGRFCDQLAPKVLQSEESEVKLGESTLVSCTVEASPAPVVQLYYQESGKTLSKVSVEALGGDLYKATAPLSDTLKDGMQTFRCRARNEYGFDVGTVQVDVPPRQDRLRCKLTGYEIHLRKAEDSEDLAKVQNVEAEKQSVEFDKLEPDTLYRVNVYPVTSQGRVPFNSSVDATTEQGGPVADLTVAWVNSSEALVTWQSPKVRNGTPVEFKVKLHPRDVGGCGVTGLEDVFLVRYPQRPPRNVKVIWAGPRSLFLSWEPVPCQEMHGPLVFYECTFKFADETGNALVTNATDPNVTLHGLQPFRKYAMRVRAVNAFGSGPLSLPVMRTTTQDRKPEQFRVEQVTDTTVQLHWEEPREPNGVLMEYEVLVEGSDEDGPRPGAKATVLADNDRTATLEDLSPGQSYKALVRALTVAGPGPYAVSHFTTAPAEYFVVGDGLYYGGFFNAPLLPGTGYKAVVLAVFENSRGSEPVRLASKPLIFTTGEAPVRLDIRSVSVYLSLWILVPVAIALSLVVITTTVLVLLLRRQEFDVTLHDPVFDEPVMRADSSACSSDEEPPKPLADYEASPNVPRIDWQTFQSTYM